MRLRGSIDNADEEYWGRYEKEFDSVQDVFELQVRKSCRICGGLISGTFVDFIPSEI